MLCHLGMVPDGSSLTNTWVNVVSPPGAGAGSYLMGSWMACSQDQQWEKRWNMLGSPARRDGPLFSTYRSEQPAVSPGFVLLPMPAARGGGHLTPGCPVPRPRFAASSLVRTSQAWGQTPAPRAISPGQPPPDNPPGHGPCPVSPFLYGGSTSRLLTYSSPLRSPCSHPLCVAAA